MAEDLVEMTEEAFKRRFDLAFTMKPDLKVVDFYHMLQSNGFDELSAMRQVRGLVNDETTAAYVEMRAASAIPAPVGEKSKGVETSSPDSSVEILGLPDMPRASTARWETQSISRDVPHATPAITDLHDSGDSSEESSDVIEGAGKQRIESKGPRKQKPQKNGGFETPTTVTEWIGKLAAGLFARTLIVCNGENVLLDESSLRTAAEAEDMSMEALIDITSDPESVRRSCWTGRDETEDISMEGKPIWKDKNAGKTGYRSAIIDGTSIRPGDFVTVRPGIDEHNPLPKKRNGEAATYAANIWFAQIVYLFEDPEGPGAHMRWLSHGGDTILKETAGPRELFVLDRCDDAPLGSVAGKIHVHFAGRENASGCGGLGAVELDYHEINNFFYRLLYSETEDSFVEARDLSALPHTGKQYCSCCEFTDKESSLKSTSIIQRPRKDGTSCTTIEAILHHGTTYKVHDFVYIIPDDLKEPYTIAQITNIQEKRLARWLKSSKMLSEADMLITAQVYTRCDDLLDSYIREFEHGNGHAQRDSRRVYRDNARSMTVSPRQLDGKCLIRHLDVIENLDDYKDMDDTFYIADQMSMRAKESPLNGRRRLAELYPLAIKDLEHPEGLETQLVIEISRIHAFRSGGSKLRALEVFSGCGGLTVGLEQGGAVATEWAIEWDTPAAETFKRNFPSAKVYNHDANILLRQAIDEHFGGTASLTDLTGKALPRMPKKGEVEFIYGGNPCQDFSRCNRYQKANSLKNSLLATFLSYVDHYRPKYFLLENVYTLLNHRLGSKQVDMHKIKGGIEMGSAKFIIRALTSLGYQVQFSVLQAEPTHVFPGPTPKPSRQRRASKPHACVTVGDAISDLPAFDWKMDIPHESALERAARDRRVDGNQSISQVPLVAGSHARIGSDMQKYAIRYPLSECQREFRRNTKNNFVKNHYTCRWDDEIMARVLRIPMRPGANHLDIPEEYDIWCLRSKESAAPKHKYYPNRYMRLDYEKPFQTCLRRIDPSGKNGNVLHPSQRRVLTVREQARAMGLPDTFTWDHNKQSPKDMYAQIGNCVAVPPGRALGKELFKVLMEKWEKENGVFAPGNSVDDGIREVTEISDNDWEDDKNNDSGDDKVTQSEEYNDGGKSNKKDARDGSEGDAEMSTSAGRGGRRSARYGGNYYDDGWMVLD